MPNYRPFFSRRRQSSSSPTSKKIRTMPVINEDGDQAKSAAVASTLDAEKTAAMAAEHRDPSVPSEPAAPHEPPVPAQQQGSSGPIPRVPLRVPKKMQRRGFGGQTVLLYVPAAHQPPHLVYKEKPSSDSRLRRLFGRWKGNDDDDDEGDFGERRRRKRFLLLLVGLLVVVIIALAVGLSLGLKNSHHSNSSDSSSSHEHFPAGSYSFNTTLQSTSTECTSNSESWRCFPYNKGGAATFSWILSALNASAYAVSSSENPFAPSFSDIPAMLLDAGRPSERLVFSFSMNRTVIPSDALTPTDRAAKCSFPNTTFEATLWTRRKGDTVLGNQTGRPAGQKFADWPADIEVTQYMNATLGEPHCVDVNGHFIADVQAGAGQCSCQYASFDLE